MSQKKIRKEKEKEKKNKKKKIPKKKSNCFFQEIDEFRPPLIKIDIHKPDFFKSCFIV